MAYCQSQGSWLSCDRATSVSYLAFPRHGGGVEVAYGINGELRMEDVLQYTSQPSPRLGPTMSLGQDADQHKFNGERFLPGYTDGAIELEHVHRYCFALPFVSGLTVADIACGEGYGSDLLAQVASSVTGVDIDTETIRTAQQRYSRANLSFVEGSAMAIPLRDQSVDVVVSFETIEHLENQDGFWSEIKRVMKPSGVLIMSSPNRRVYGEQRSNANPFHLRELTREELEDQLAARFAHHTVLSQSVVFGSLLLPVSVEATQHVVISLDPATGVLTWQEGGNVKHPYSVTLASDGILPTVGQSLYAGHYPPGAMAALAGGIVERDQLSRELKGELAELEINCAASVAAAQHERDEAIRATKDVEKSCVERLQSLTVAYEESLRQAALTEARLTDELQVLTAQRDDALSRAKYTAEVVAEQDSLIEALKAFVNECQNAKAAAGYTVPGGSQEYSK